MSTQTQTEIEEMGPTKPVKEHEWLQKLVGEWRTESEMYMGPDQPSHKSQGTESIKSLAGLWAFGEGNAKMHTGDNMTYYVALGYDVSFKEYRGFMIMDVSSHQWNYTGKLSGDGRVMTLDCVGPNMTKDGETANYRDVIEIIDDNHRTLTSYWEDENGEYQVMMKSVYTRV